MINSLSYDELVSKIKEKGLSEEEIGNKIEAKMKQLSGLVSKEGAAHIIANELGVKVFEEVGEIKIKDAKPGMRNVNMNGKTTMLFGIREFKTEKREGRVGSFLMGDETGTIRVVLWDENHLKEIENNLKEEIIVRVEDGYVRENNGYREIHLSNRSKLTLNPEGVEIKEVIANSAPISVDKKIKELSEGDRNISLKGTVVQVFDPRFFEVCPNCGKRVKVEGSEFKCAEHESVSPVYSSVINCVLDDGSESIRVVGFREVVAKILNINDEDLKGLRENPAKFEELKESVLGRQIKVEGRVVKNEMFGNIEFMSNNIEELNPEELLKEMESK